jgi:hypothetical protein
LCLSPPPPRCRRSSLLSPVYSYLCSLSVCCQFKFLVQANQRFSWKLLSSPSLFPLPTGFDRWLSWPCTRLPDYSARPWPWIHLPSRTLALTWIFDSCLPGCYNKHCYFDGLHLGLTLIPDKKQNVHLVYHFTAINA